MYDEINVLCEKYSAILEKCMACTCLDEYSDLVSSLDATTNNRLHKLNLTTDHGSNEGIWALLLSDEDVKLVHNDSSSNDKYVAILCNTPVFWDMPWGAFVVGTTQGPLRPKALIDDQHPISIVAANKHIRTLIEKETTPSGEEK